MRRSTSSPHELSLSILRDTAAFVALLERLSPRLRLPALFLASRQPPALLSFGRGSGGDVDVERSRIRSRGVKGRRGTRRALWRHVPPWLMDVLVERVPPDDRTETRHLFLGLNEGTERSALARASRAAGLPVYRPHDLRHRRGSLWHASGMPARELAERMGHSKASMSLDVYTHVMPPDEVPSERLTALLGR